MKTELKALLSEFEQVKAEYAEPNSTIDMGNLYHYACKFADILANADSVARWQIIETAPKDGIRYLGMIVADRFYGEPFVCYYDEDEGHICLHQTEARLHRPTHWIPFPNPSYIKGDL